MERKITSVAALMGIIAIILGAFGAHALKKQLSVEQLSAFETGVKYQMYHALFLLFLGMNTYLNEKVKKTVFQLVVFGVFFFSGSIYLLTTKPILGVDFKFIGIVTPIGGVLLLLGWSLLFWNIWKKKT
ncbi:DUF423 domain-containing protein [Flavobacterium paronense]|uniref:DUF423 domain-containing protein n=1 Tax=Flavobacterium paronense TaxID=1392775 RepID=A0ABV5GFF9_9FLAO|nr:DUF423 domain-containing protein [Flavobacterium paronense]MDN3678168.1 DUF423 domain-containing protein [Flavobacterium paronense]